MNNKYCVGCGLCKSEYGCEKKYEKGFVCYDLSNVDKEFINNICPSAGYILDKYNNSVWGNYISVKYGWSLDKDIRFKASSGGIITSLAIFLLEKKYIDEVIQIKASNSSPLETQIIVSKNKDDVLSAMGSRYTNSSVLENLSEIIDENKKYAIIGRPCDIQILKQYQKKYNKYNNIIYTIAFFCAGNPSKLANIKMLNEMGINNGDVERINYRGYGWPGYAKAFDKNGNEYKMKYNISWGDYLGRDIRLMCKFCLDGCGAAADISCGDYWHITNDNKTIFEENEGRNLIFARTELGLQLLNDAKESNIIDLFDYENESDLKYIQPAQFDRTTTMFDKMLAFKLFFRKTPNYDMRKLRIISKNNSIKRRTRIFLGTIKRMINKKM